MFFSLVAGFILTSSSLTLLFLKMYPEKNSWNCGNTLDLESLELLTENTLNTLVTMVEIRDSYTVKHSSNVALYAYNVAKKMELTDVDCANIYMGCKLHDLGKIYISDEILTKPSRLTEEEFNIVKDHPIRGHQIVSKIKVFQNTCIPDIVLYHHERVDGSGYPSGLAQDDIPIAARIVAICDAYDAMTTTRSYRKAMEPEMALETIMNQSGKQFDPIITQVFIECIRNNHMAPVRPPIFGTSDKGSLNKT
ncbi:HD-GYP domain-containing protein [Paenibacillus periandrae]|uniref:HD-GYP domain-containing protein n=1 Tax=Paenibacillus periandrae TaxID=1761741 RepID=UPI001F08DA30|nr:HD-GYP domain-containing protein [Paenibacillus periandrae]